MLQKNGADEAKCKTSDFLGIYKRVHGVVDPYIFFGLKTSSSKSYGMAALDRIIGYTKAYVNQYKWTADRASQTIRVTLDFISTHGAVSFLASQDWAAGQFDWIPVAASASALMNKALASAWDTCVVIENWLMKTDVGDPEKLDGAIDAAMRGA